MPIPESEIILNEVVAAYQRSFKEHTGRFIVEFWRTAIALSVFCGAALRTPNSSEVRNSTLLSPDYR